MGTFRLTGKPLPPASLPRERAAVPPGILAHAMDVYGSREAALDWLGATCGALENRSPLELLQEGKYSEVERILHCIDHGMIA